MPWRAGFGSASVPPAIFVLWSPRKTAGGTPALPNPHHRTTFGRNSNSSWIRLKKSRLHLGRPDMFGALVPPFAAQPFFQRVKMDLRVRAAETLDIRLESRFIEPAEHPIELIA